MGFVDIIIILNVYVYYLKDNMVPGTIRLDNIFADWIDHLYRRLPCADA